jgi:hypothetical protein
MQTAIRPATRDDRKASVGFRTGFMSLLTPSAFAAAYVLISFANTPTPIGGLVRPLLIAIVMSVALTAFVVIVSRRRPVAVIVGTLAVLSLSAPWLALAVIAVAIVWAVLVAIGRWLRGAPLPPLRLERVSAVTSVFGAFFLSVSALFAAPAAFASVGLGFDASPGAPVDGDPDIIVLLLDGYPRSDVLSEAFGYDNSNFEEELRTLGFTLSEESRSNYTATWATLASLFHGEYLDAIPELLPFPTDATGQYTALMRAIAHGERLAALRERGYEVVTIPPPFGAAALLSADRTVDSGQITSFELSLLQHSPLLNVVQAVDRSFVLDQQRDRIASDLRSLTQVAAEKRERPAFLWAHLLNPHAPILYNADGSPAPLPMCFPDDCSLWAFARESEWDRLPGQVTSINRLVIRALTDVVRGDPDAIVVVMSDHGHRAPDRPESDLLANFMAIRMPNGAALSVEVAPVDLLAAISAAAFNSSFQPHAYRAWISDAEAPLTMHAFNGS